MRILLAEDDSALVERMRDALTRAGFVVVHCTDGIEAEYLGQVEDFAAAVVDLGLPGLDGLSVLERWLGAGHGLPVLVLTARARWHDKLAGFDAGADDSLTKPFQVDELLLRLRAPIRRSTGHAHPCLQCGPLRLDSNAGRFELNGEPLRLTTQEFRILSYFMYHPNTVISRARLGEHVYDAGFDPDSNTLDVLLGLIRRKLGVDLFSLLALVESDAGGRVQMRQVPDDTRYGRVFSGASWQVFDGDGHALLQSRSLWDQSLTPPNGIAEGLAHALDLSGPMRQPLRARNV